MFALIGLVTNYCLNINLLAQHLISLAWCLTDTVFCEGLHNEAEDVVANTKLTNNHGKTEKDNELILLKCFNVLMTYFH